MGIKCLLSAILTLIRLDKGGAPLVIYCVTSYRISRLLLEKTLFWPEIYFYTGSN